MIWTLLACWPNSITHDAQDMDRDGFNAPADCDDLDPNVYPGAPERWYDGVDQDCDGGNDFDQDGDGYEVLEDCDDLEPEVHPGAEDAPYDLLDANCDGEDEADLDGDGWPWTEDCDDEDAAVHPGAQETWYDGIDQNCDGADDFDADEDGFEVDRDCDDLDPRAFPGAEEIWYDGIDQDCDGADDMDRDGDGSPLDEDCDDEDPERFPGNPELCDGLDQDCDEDIDEDIEGPIAWYVDADGDGWGEAWAGEVDTCEELPSGAATLAGDCDGEDDQVSPGADESCGNGVDDDCDGLALGCPVSGWQDKQRQLAGTRELGGLALVDGSLWAGTSAGLVDLEGAMVTGPSGLGGSLASLDADGDGYEDLLASSDEGAFLLYGPVSATTLSAHGASVGTVVALGDVDGDGLEDFALDGAVVLADGSSTPSDEDALFSVGSDRVAAVDHDGDGLPEVLVGTPGSAASSAFLVPGDSAGSAGLDEALWTLSPSDELGMAVAGGDIDGDGYEDLLVGQPDSTFGNAFVALGPVGGRTSKATLVELRGPTRGDWGALVAAVDVDGDGAAEPILAGSESQSSAGTETGCVLVAWGVDTTHTAPQSLDSDEAALSCGSYEGDAYGSTLAVTASAGTAQIYVGAAEAEEVWLFTLEPDF